jgi:uncharacterized protein YdhG (YjbR/CyaY superfamily)
MTAASVDEYIAQAPVEVRDQLEAVRRTIKEAAPEAEESISYQMPYYRYKGRLVYFGLAKKHIGIYAILEPVRSQFKEELNGYEQSKGTIRFPFDDVRLDLLAKLVKAQVAEHNRVAAEKRSKS